MSRLLIIGCGGVAQVAIRKCCQNSEVFTDIMIASRTLSKCDDLKAKLEGKTASRIETARVDADNVEELKTLIGARLDDTDLIMTGWVLSDELRPYIDEIYHLIPEKIPEKQGKDIDN